VVADAYAFVPPIASRIGPGQKLQVGANSMPVEISPAGGSWLDGQGEIRG